MGKVTYLALSIIFVASLGAVTFEGKAYSLMSYDGFRQKILLSGENSLKVGFKKVKRSGLPGDFKGLNISRNEELVCEISLQLIECEAHAFEDAFDTISPLVLNNAVLNAFLVENEFFGERKVIIIPIPRNCEHYLLLGFFENEGGKWLFENFINGRFHLELLN